MLPYSPNAFNRKLHLRKPNQNLLLVLFEQKLSKISENCARSNGITIIEYGNWVSLSNLSANKIWKTKIGKTRIFEIAELTAVLRWANVISGVRIKILQNISEYNIITKHKHNMIHTGTNIISQLHVRNPSSFNGMKTNWSAFTARNNSNCKKWERLLEINTYFKVFIIEITSNDRSFCFTAQIQKNTLTMLATINGMNTKIHKCLLPDVKRSQIRNSNISKIRCNDSDISIDLNWMYESFSIR